MFNFAKWSCAWSGHKDGVGHIHENVTWSNTQKKFYVEILGKCNHCGEYYDLGWNWLTPAQYIQYIRKHNFDKAVDDYPEKGYVAWDTLWDDLDKKLETKRKHKC